MRPRPEPRLRLHTLLTWSALILAAAAEAGWANALGAGLHTWSTVLIFVVSLAASFGGLGWAMRSIPMGTAYAVWTGLGAAFTAVWAGLHGETFGAGKTTCLCVIVAAVVGLQLTSATPQTHRQQTQLKP